MIAAPRILFVLPTRGANGGANSVVQEAMGLDRFGCNVGIAVHRKYLAEFRANYLELRSGGVRLHAYADAAELGAVFQGFDIAVATIYKSVFEIADAAAAVKSRIRVAYYVQDYEPFFHEANTPDWKLARASYAKVPDCVMFAKTDWIRRMVFENHGLRPLKVEPSIDHEIYYPALDRPQKGLRISAMLRPHTPRRAPYRTVRILSRLAQELPRDVSFTVFGADEAGLQQAGIVLPPRIQNLGRLKRTEVPEVLRESDIFIDASDYQAFGRTGLEGMACGCVPVVPVFGGADEYAVHMENALVVDTRFDDEIVGAITHFVSLPKDYQDQIRFNAMQRAADFTIKKAALSELKIFAAMAAGKL